MEKVSINRARTIESERNAAQLLERERQRLAFDLHDGPAQSLSSALLQADILADLIESKEAMRELESLKMILSQSLQELRLAIYSLKPHNPTTQGLIARIKEHTQQLSTKTGIQVDFVSHLDECNLAEDMRINLFRIIQEALHNVHKHAQATHVAVMLSSDSSQLTCSIKDDGVGFDAGTIAARAGEFGGYGLISMRHRVEQFLGTFEIDSEPGRGSSIHITIPL